MSAEEQIVVRQNSQTIVACMIKDVVIVDGECLLTEAIEIMRRKNIGSILVKEAAGELGIFTERDLLTKINFKNSPLAEFNSIKIKNVMSRNLRAVSPQDSYTETIRLMQANNIRHMPVLDEGKIVGIVSFKDLMRYHEQHLEQLNSELSDKTRQLTQKTIKLNAIIRLSEQLISNMEMRELLAHIMHVARDLVHADTSSVVLLREDKGQLAVIASETEGSTMKSKLIQPSLDENTSLTGWVVKNKQPLLLYGRLSDDPRFKNIQWKEDIKCSINVPLIYKNSVKGTLNLNITKSDYMFTQEDFETAIVLANYASVAIENSGLFKNLQKSLINHLKITNEEISQKNEELRITQERINKEIKTVAIVQQGLLPKSLPQNSRVDIAAIYSASSTVGGDYYDCIEMSDGKLGLVMADITGHGLPAAFIMTMVKILLIYLNEQKRPLAETVSAINDMVTKHVPLSTFPSLIYGILDPEKMVFNYINAGHQPIVHTSPSAKKKIYYAKSSLLGIEAGANFALETITIEKGDKLFFYTDGIPEAMNKNKEIFGYDRIFFLFEHNAAKSPKEIIDAVLNELNLFCEGVPLVDDVTMMVLGF